ncbi:MAG TPA: V-type ATPase 116kDa subunit family protein [Syntrophorhabdaceae bacterium]|nr:V-type ATPase 116kDa subunit family protein [Syntrophorhabdaceae bacterium]HOL05868.1 V-type ATPase 116kDa subunit family protein [Syntrophorhabdaceae bacterium]HON84637.1 V-type ATPase 116kDa subunit family protein [Syntrophorhabdaceae bacterium]HOT42163.1 V-type ATPase 116kDa subunit family protein [Syntrophorhabdaceae bacterium]HQE80438.1 V-type ATPase 116kDa subunit family protein [Syntrophorhabdaceae bacterium]
MFSAEPMMHIQAVILARDERAVLMGLGELGAVHLTKTKSGYGHESSELPDKSSELARLERIRNRIQEIRQSIDLAPSYIEPSSKDMSIEKAEDILDDMEKKCREVLEEKQQIIHRQKELTEVSQTLYSYSGFAIPLIGPDEFAFLHFATGILPQQNFERILRDVGDRAALITLSQQRNQQVLLAMTTRDYSQELESILQKAGFQKESLPVEKGATIDSLLEKNKIELGTLSSKLEEINKRIDALREEFKDILAEIEWFVDLEFKLNEAGQKFTRTDVTVMLSGWAPSRDIGLIEKRLKDITGGRYILNLIPPDTSIEEQVPVLLRHPWFLRPFEMLVAAYGLPNYRELEPTLFVALSYIVMFGMMFGDAGHGLVLAGCGVAALVLSRSRQVRDFGVLLIFAGLSSMVFGVVYGSYFGIEELKKYAIWHDPLDCDPIKLMYGAITIGIVMISLGLILNAINHFKRGNFVAGILDKFGLIGIVFYWGALIILIKGAAIKASGLMGIFLVLFLGVPIIGWAIKEPIEHILRHKKEGHHEGEEGIVAAIMESCVGAFEAILSYLANTISFVRLAAYAMSHAALLFAAFMVAKEVKGIPYVGSAFSIVIIILGNIVAIVLEGVIASVQALRLEYYEFFGKFFSGSGRPFEPFYLAITDKDKGYDSTK